MKNRNKTVFGITLMTVMLMVSVTSSRATEKLLPSRRITLEIEYKQSQPNDTLSLVVAEKCVAMAVFPKAETYYATKSENGKYHFSVPANYNAGYFLLKAKRTYTYRGGMTTQMDLLYPQFWEAGDSVQISINHWERPANIFSLCNFNGIGAEKYKARFAVNNFRLSGVSEIGTNAAYSGSSSLSDIAREQLRQLELFKEKISPLSYNILKGDIYFSGKSYFAIDRDGFLRITKGHNLEDIAENRLAVKSIFYDNEPDLAYSSNYLEYSYATAKRVAYISDPSESSQSIFRTIAQNFDGQIRNSLLLYFFKSERLSDNADQLFKQAELYATDAEAKRAIKELATILPGRIIKDYSLLGMDGKKVNLASFDDKIVLIDFYFTGCGGCQSYYRNVLSKVERKFKDNSKIVFLSIATDPSPATWKKSVLSGEYTSPDVVNLNTDGLGFKHPIITDNNIFSYPTVMFLGKGRKLRLYNHEKLYSYDSLLKEIESSL